jgi:CheY-like chemotaxis protein
MRNAVGKPAKPDLRARMEEKNRILIVDDDIPYAELLKLQLEKTGAYEVKIVADGTAVVAAAREFKPRLILLDILMPGQDGGETAAQLAEDELLQDIPVVFLTSIVTRAEMAAKGGLVHGKPFLAKPVNAQELDDTIRKYLKK